MISNEYGDVRKVQVRITAALEYLHNYGWIQSDWGCVVRGSYFDCDAILSPLLSSPLLTFLPPDLPSSTHIEITEDQLTQCVVTSLLSPVPQLESNVSRENN